MCTALALLGTLAFFCIVAIVIQRVAMAKERGMFVGRVAGTRPTLTNVLQPNVMATT